MRNPTLKDVAQFSGFSLTTVSRVLSGSDYPVSKKTRISINNAARELGYFPNLLARSLKTHESREIAIVVPSITNPFYTGIIMGAEEILSAHQFHMLVYLTGNRREQDSQLVEGLRSKMIAGVIIAADSITDGVATGFLTLRENGIPCIVTDYSPKTQKPMQGVFFDHRSGGRMAGYYLLDNGHTKIAYGTQALDRPSRCMRKDGFWEAFTGTLTDFSQQDIYISNQQDEFAAGIELVKKMINANKGYTAIAVNNDAVAMGVLAGLAMRGITVPNQISVLGFDDSTFSRMATPPLTTIQVPSEQVGRLAAEAMLKELETPSTAYSIYLEPKIMERKTVAKR